MIRLGLRLTLSGGKEAATRLAVTAVAVALGVGVLLITLAGINALHAQKARGAWLHTDTGSTPAAGSTPATAGASAPDPLWWLVSTDRFGNQVINRIDVAATGPRSPIPPGIPRLPGPGQFYASPALSQLLRSTPAAELSGRFPGHQIGTIGRPALPAPNALIIVIGRRASQLSRAPGTEKVTSIQAGATRAGVPGGASATDEAILAVAALALLFPVLTFISTATRLAAARREQRFAAMRLVGATPRQVSVVSAVEASVAALSGVAAGFGLFFLLRPAVATIPFTGSPFFPGDLSLSLADILLVALGIPVLAGVVARAALRRVQISPLGVSRRVTPRAPRAWRVIPLVAGIGELAYFAGVGHPGSTQGQTEAFFLGFFLLIAGLIVAGPWLAMTGSAVMARRARRPAALIAGRRLSDNPRAAFRSVSGLILTLFVASVATGVITTLVADQGAPKGGSGAASTLVDEFGGGQTASGRPVESVAPVTGALLTGLRAIPGIRGVTVIYADPQAARGTSPDTGLVSCAELSRTPALGRCAAGAAVASITPDFGGSRQAAMTGKVWPAAAVSVTRLSGLPAQTIVAATNGSGAAIERARTVLELAFPDLGRALTIGERDAESQAQITEWQHDTDAVILASLPIAGCSLAVSVAAGLTDRRRPFSLLRLTGAPLSMLRRVVVLESAVPLIVIAVMSAGTGLLASGLFLRSQFGVSLRPPGAEYYASVLAGLVISLAVIAATLPLLNRITEPETTRNE
jgi:FtsX-like permease family protein